MEKRISCYTCARMDCDDKCRVVMIIQDPDARRFPGGLGSADTGMLDRILHKDCSHYLAPVAEDSAAFRPLTG